MTTTGDIWVTLDTRSSLGEISNEQAERRLILRSTPAIPRGSTKLRQATGPQATDLKRVLKPRGQFSTACGP